LNNFEKAEAAIITGSGFAVYAIASVFVGTYSLGMVILAMSAVLLIQSLLRDLVILARQSHVQQSSNKRAMRCMCVESTVGITGVAVAAGMVCFNIDLPMSMTQLRWTLAAFSSLAVGFAIKDLVISLDPVRIVRDKDHLNIIVKLKKQ